MPPSLAPQAVKSVAFTANHRLSEWLGLNANLPLAVLAVYACLQDKIWRTGDRPLPDRGKKDILSPQARHRNELLRPLLATRRLMTFPCRSEIERGCGLSTRTVYRSLQAIQNLGLAVQHDIGKEAAFEMGEIRPDDKGVEREVLYRDGFLLKLNEFVMSDNYGEPSFDLRKQRVETFLQRYLPFYGRVPKLFTPSAQELRGYTDAIVAYGFPFAGGCAPGPERLKFIAPEWKDSIPPAETLGSQQFHLDRSHRPILRTVVNLADVGTNEGRKWPVFVVPNQDTDTTNTGQICLQTSATKSCVCGRAYLIESVEKAIYTNYPDTPEEEVAAAKAVNAEETVHTTSEGSSLPVGANERGAYLVKLAGGDGSLPLVENRTAVNVVLNDVLPLTPSSAPPPFPAATTDKIDLSDEIKAAEAERHRERDESISAPLVSRKAQPKKSPSKSYRESQATEPRETQRAGFRRKESTPPKLAKPPKPPKNPNVAQGVSLEQPVKSVAGVAAVNDERSQILTQLGKIWAKLIKLHTPDVGFFGWEAKEQAEIYDVFKRVGQYSKDPLKDMHDLFSFAIASWPQRRLAIPTLKDSDLNAWLLNRSTHKLQKELPRFSRLHQFLKETLVKAQTEGMGALTDHDKSGLAKARLSLVEMQALSPGLDGVLRSLGA